MDKMIVETESGSLYPVLIEKHLLGKKRLKIVIKGKEEIIAGVGNDRVDGIIAAKDKCVNENDIAAGKVIVFGDGGHTSRIKTVYVPKN